MARRGVLGRSGRSRGVPWDLTTAGGHGLVVLCCGPVAQAVPKAAGQPLPHALLSGGYSIADLAVSPLGYQFG
jgi:hypothetical protein